MSPKSLLVAALFAATVSAESIQCSIPYSIMYSIAKNESHPNRPAGYPYLISFNTRAGKEYGKRHFHENMMDARTVDCKNRKLCVEMVEELFEQGIVNMDLGPFQINYKYHPGPVEDYFMVDKSYRIACRFIERLVDKYGWGWATIGMYHSGTVHLRDRYAKNVYNNYLKILRKGKKIEKQ